MKASQQLTIVAESDLVVFGDGMESDTLSLSWGERLDICIAEGGGDVSGAGGVVHCQAQAYHFLIGGLLERIISSPSGSTGAPPTPQHPEHDFAAPWLSEPEQMCQLV